MARVHSEAVNFCQKKFNNNPPTHVKPLQQTKWSGMVGDELI